ncbi:helix-turn-helix domain-containing protein [Streptomyces sp. NPDC091377]|uniref:helix-turn-helix domain-containing protein n=1 Tax=unclassified Streptomyces TaxID=2593676 RepID=UPI00382C4AC6
MKTEGGSLELGVRLRRVRAERGLSLRELGKLAGCSASLISQVERGQTAPSAGVIYGLANALDIPLEYLFGTGGADEVPEAGGGPRTRSPFATASGTVNGSRDGTGAGTWDGAGARDGGGGRSGGGPQVPGAPSGPALAPATGTVVQRAADRRTIDLASGVRWERLTPQQDARVDFLEVVYAPYGRSTDSRAPIRHEGREYQLVLTGTLHADIGFETYVLEAGDSLAFDSATPHQYRNMTDGEVRVVSVVVHALTP